ncbi:hypothetical protein TBKG_00804 [Mycobacterium tuberculosis '98-R604 INH-RIF-EM']|uniref:Uncharacterized protein n=3 Tax=Mycobacterium tuberculosis TaxID=1773 RepID=A5U5A2_MYCTA|nr:hypothetical protein MT2480 [Mycobacterium tuberculosis CDC1551]ABQ74202.1 hypothetical protein MRA_2432 [Mycobacterium tuberculosis H37Ra]EFD47958.1 conserved hypothetical protein [Mycobacterium tuberculosis T17]EPZ65467.1 hypothetical protein TBKG_00804 [Mycobacterium tuberculosis '98-R604 INH-RIF-EM']CCK60514.1 Conserved protein of unknown function [Mycobacterium canettii CIPT 140070010]
MPPRCCISQPPAAAFSDRVGFDDRRWPAAPWRAGASGLTGLLGKTVWRPRVSTDPALVRAIYFLPYRSPWCRGWLVIAGVLAPRVHLDSV